MYAQEFNKNLGVSAELHPELVCIRGRREHFTHRVGK
jgi:hypothetical protein